MILLYSSLRKSWWLKHSIELSRLLIVYVLSMSAFAKSETLNWYMNLRAIEPKSKSQNWRNGHYGRFGVVFLRLSWWPEGCKLTSAKAFRRRRNFAHATEMRLRLDLLLVCHPSGRQFSLSQSSLLNSGGKIQLNVWVNMIFLMKRVHVLFRFFSEENHSN